METRSKRRRLMMVSSYVSPRRSDLPATFESLNNDTLTTVLEFVGKKSYRSFGGLNKHCKEIYRASGMTKETFMFGYAPLSVIKDTITSYSARVALSKGVVLYSRLDVLDWALGQRTYLLREICDVAGEEGRIDILDEVWNYIMNDEDRKRYAFGYVDEYAARGGKLNVLKWYETKGLLIDKKSCAEAAARNGHLHIIHWLREEKGLELDVRLYNEAIRGNGQLRVMKWLKEQACPWIKSSFGNAACRGNFNILKWLQRALKPEVIDWCRSNGYGDRIFFRND